MWRKAPRTGRLGRVLPLLLVYSLLRFLQLSTSHVVLPSFPLRPGSQVQVLFLPSDSQAHRK